MLERYPANGRLLKIYGRFLEWVQNEPSRAQKYYEVRRGHALGQTASPGESQPCLQAPLQSLCWPKHALWLLDPAQEAIKLGLQDSMLELIGGGDAVAGAKVRGLLQIVCSLLHDNLACAVVMK